MRNFQNLPERCSFDTYARHICQAEYSYLPVRLHFLVSFNYWLSVAQAELGSEGARLSAEPPGAPERE
jgi:hypothetical protein